MLLDINGDSTEVVRTRDALTSIAPHDEVMIVHERADGAVLRAVGSSATGFVVDVRGGHTGDQTSASRLPASAIESMFDRFAARDTGWPGAVIWQQGTPVATHRRRSGLGVRILAIIIGIVGGVAVLVVLRSAVTVPWLCERDGRDVESVRLGTAGVGPSGTECVFADGAVESVFDLDAGLAWAELGGSLLVAALAGYVVVRLISSVASR